MNVWKIGSRWGEGGKSVLDVFLDYECVFFHLEPSKKIGNWNAVQPGDFFIIQDGAIPVALAKANDEFRSYEESRIHFTTKEKGEFVDDHNVVICSAKIVILPQEKRDFYRGGDPQKRFCRYGNDNVIDQLPQIWEELSSQNEFRIIPGTASLWGNDKCIFSDDARYRFPRYQRQYSWGENELRKLLENLQDAVNTHVPVFMGTMQLSQPIPLDACNKLKGYHIIDGQQRITTFVILANVLEKKLGLNVIPYAENKLRTSVSSGEEQLKLDQYSAFISRNQGDNAFDGGNTYIQNFYAFENLLDEYFSGGTKEETVNIRCALYNFIKSDKILFVTLETHAGLSKTLQIFNTINTAGMDLGATDLFKIRFYDYLKNQGANDSVFDEISDIYASIEEYNRNNRYAPKSLSMADVLRTYQRIICAKFNLPQSAFGKSYESFFEELFNTLLRIRQYDEFAEKNIELSIDDLPRIIDCYKEIYAFLESDPHFHIIHNMIWETRYGHYAWDLPIIARFFDRISSAEIFNFTMSLFKKLCPPSLGFARQIDGVKSAIFDALKDFATSENRGVGTLDSKLGGPYRGSNLQALLESGCGEEIANYPKWKNLICRLVEYLKTDSKDQQLLQRLWSEIDIEHIQSATPEENTQQVIDDWGEEINKLGNMVILERSINRRIQNHSQAKPTAYLESKFASVKELSNKVGNWNRNEAVTRRNVNAQMLMDFLLS